MTFEELFVALALIAYVIFCGAVLVMVRGHHKAKMEYLQRRYDATKFVINEGGKP